MKKLLQAVAFVMLALPMWAQSEKLNQSESAALSVGRARPSVEVLRPEAPVPVAALDALAVKVQTENLDAVAVRDQLSILAEQNPGHNYVAATIRDANGNVKYSATSHNLRTDAGDDWQSDLMGKTTAPAVNTQCNYIALTNDAGAPSAADTTLASEIAANGLSRAQGTYAHSAGTSVYTISKTFTATGTQSFQKAGMFTASSSGTMCFETAVTSGTVNNTDTLTFTWTINF